MVASYNEREYRRLINYDLVYRTNRQQLVQWLHLNDLMDDFLHEINCLRSLNDMDQLYYIALDYSIPISLVKLIYKEVNE